MITSLDNKSVKQLCKLHQKKYRDDRFLLLDEQLVKIAYDYNYLDTLVYTDKLPFEFNNVIEVSREVLNKISKTDNLNYLGVCRQIKENDNYGNRVIILDHLQDPLNIGRIMEAAYLFGYDSIILSDESVDIYNEKCIRNSKGSIFKLNICHKNLFDEVKLLKNMGYKVYATGLRNNTKQMHELSNSEKMAFILGNEGSGVDITLMDIADDTVKIDMLNIDSLNVAMAASIIMYYFKNI